VERQPTRSKRVVADRRFDKTQLRARGHGRTVHRDYAAHAFRWNFTAHYIQDLANIKIALDSLNVMCTAATTQEELDRIMKLESYIEDIFLKYGWVQRHVKQGLKILDVGCGQDQPLLYVLGARMPTVPELYVGVDLNRIGKKSQVRWAKIHDELDFTNHTNWLLTTYGEFDLVTCFEVIEHMQVEDGAKLLRGIHKMLEPGGRLFLSTPVFNGSAAANHCHEWTIPELWNELETQGFSILHRYGTFASKYDIYGVLSKEQQATYDKLERYYGNDILSCMYAPLYPDQSRNNLWICSRQPDEKS
jgi:2-polyprenyl-3-methyl-5-hydroxy-6-metoxy-1,4-benzoquinol methylase